MLFVKSFNFIFDIFLTDDDARGNKSIFFQLTISLMMRTNILITIIFYINLLPKKSKASKWPGSQSLNKGQFFFVSIIKIIEYTC